MYLWILELGVPEFHAIEDGQLHNPRRGAKQDLLPAHDDPSMNAEDRRHTAVSGGGRGRITTALLLLLLLCLGAESAAGHALVVKTSLGDRPVKPDTPTTVVFSFSQKVQLPFTKVLLVSADGGERSLKLTPGKSQGEVEVELPGLPAGRYLLRYNVLAIDGHFTQGVVRFQVAAPREK